MTLSNMSPSHPFARRRGYERCKDTKKNVLLQDFSEKNWNYLKSIYLCSVHTHAFGRNGWNGDILESVIDALFLAI